MTPRLSIIAASIRRVLNTLLGDIGTYADEYWSSVVLALRGNTPSDPFWANTSLLMHTDEADASWANVVLGMHMGGGEVDPYWSSVSLLMLMNGTNASTAIGDVTGKTVTVAGNAAISTTQSKFGGASCYFDGTGDYLSLATSASFGFGTGDLTVEAWIYPSVTTGADRTITNFRTSTAGGERWTFFIDNAAGKLAVWDGSTKYGANGTAVLANQWSHVACVRSSGVLYVFLNGVVDFAVACTIDFGSTKPCSIGAAYFDGSSPFTGYIDNLRITKGVARYTDTFDPPRKEFPAGATTIYDVKGHPVTVYGNTAIVATKSRFGGYSCYFDGTGDYLSTPHSTDFNIESGDFTIEAWVYRNVVGVQHYICGKRPNGAPNDGWEFRINAGNDIQFFYTTGSSAGSTLTVPSGVWTHVAVTRSGTSVRLFINGVLDSTVTFSNGITNTTSTFKVGVGSAIDSPMNGYIDDLRVTKGVARYTATFTPPARAFPHDLPFVDEKGKYPVVTGTPSISTTTPKFGGATASFNGTTDYLTFDAHADFGLGTDNYTIEGWIKTAAVGTILDTRNYAADYGLFYIATGGYLAHDHTYGALVGTISVTDDTWHHVAFVRNNSVLTMYVDGKDSGAYVSNANLGTLRQARIGAKVDGTSFYSGLMDEIRVTKAARYVSEFTPQAYGIADSNNNLLLQDETGTKVVTSYGNAGVSTTQVKYGNGALYFDGTGDRLAIPMSSDFDFGTGDFTVEFWYYPISAVASDRVIQTRDGDLYSGIYISHTNATTLSLAVSINGTSFPATISSTISQNSWQHVAFVRSSGRCSAYIGGALNGTPFTQAGALYYNAADTMVIGGQTSGRTINGYIDDLRITKGVARYLSTFTPPARENANYGKPTRYDPYWDAVVLGMHMDDVGLADVKSHTVTLSGTAARSATQSKFGGYSAVVAGSTGYVSVADSADFVLGSVFTIELWVYQTAYANASNYNSLIGQRAAGANAWFIQLFAGQGSMYGPSFQINNSGGTALLTVNPPTATTYNPTLNTWHHIAVTCDGTTARVFFNGQIAGSAAFTGSIVDTASALTIGYLPQYTENCTGYIDDVRITKGAARYIAAFQPAQYAFPETRLPVKTHVDPYYDSVKLNAHFNGPTGSAALVDEMGLHKFTVYQAAQSSGWLAFDGVDDVINLDGSGDFAPGTADFTLEVTVYVNSLTKPVWLWDCRSANGAFLAFVIHTDGEVQYFVNTSNYICRTGAGAVVISKEYHIALCRSSAVTRLFINGALVSSGADTINLSSNANRPYIGGNAADPSNAAWRGNFKIKDLRWTLAARYTAPFTAPALPNPDYKTAPAATDPYWKNVVLHMPMNGADAGTTFTENTGKTITVTGNTSTQVEQYRFGGSSAYFDGTFSKLTAALPTLDTGDFTIELWYQPGVIDLQVLVDTRSGNNTSGVAIDLGNSVSGKIDLFTGAAARVVGTTTLVVGTWYHLAATRASGQLKLFINGVQEGSAYTDPGTYNSTSLTIGNYIGSTDNTTNVQGYIDDLRITKGVARYTSTFTPPSLPNPTGYDPYAPNVVLHLPMNTDFTDGTGKTVTVNGNSVISTTVKKFGAGSGYFDGAGDYLSIPDSADFDFGSASFTLESWVMFNATPTGMTIASNYGSASTGWTLEAASSFLVARLSGDGADITGATTLVTGRWYHVALSLAPSSAKLFLDGVQQGSTYTGAVSLDTASAVTVGGIGASAYLNGYLDDLRITKGVARYTAAFTPPKEPFALL